MTRQLILFDDAPPHDGASFFSRAGRDDYEAAATWVENEYGSGAGRPRCFFVRGKIFNPFDKYFIYVKMYSGRRRLG